MRKKTLIFLLVMLSMFLLTVNVFAQENISIVEKEVELKSFLTGSIECTHNFVPATCKDPEKCTICGETRGAALGHTKGTVVLEKAATCTEAGSTTYKCTVCSENFTVTGAAALGHKYTVTKTVEKTCTTDGYIVYKCANCNGEKTETPADQKAGHTITYKVVKEATCTEAGERMQICQVCNKENPNGQSYDKTIPTVSHSWKEATCQAPETCSKCGLTRNSAVDHSFENGACKFCGTKDPNMCKNGHNFVNGTCSRCGAAGCSAGYHSPRKKIVSPTCVDGYTISVCRYCGVELSEKTDIVKGEGRHTFENGSCIICGMDFEETEQTISPEHVHTYGQDKVTPPTCSEEGYTLSVCSECGAEYGEKTDIVAALGEHQYENGVCIFCNLSEPVVKTPYYAAIIVISIVVVVLLGLSVAFIILYEKGIIQRVFRKIFRKRRLAS